MLLSQKLPLIAITSIILLQITLGSILFDIKLLPIIQIAHLWLASLLQGFVFYYVLRNSKL